MAEWIEDPQGRPEVEKVTKELKLLIRRLYFLLQDADRILTDWVVRMQELRLLKEEQLRRMNI